MDLGLAGKSVIVTGGASNIGRAIVLTYAKENAKITLADLDEEQGEKVAALALEHGAQSVQVVKTDITQLSDVESMVKKTIDKHGGVDILVNNVGWDKLQFFMETTPDFWQKIIQINFIGMLNCTQAVLNIGSTYTRDGITVQLLVPTKSHQTYMNVTSGLFEVRMKVINNWSIN
ncbi:MAG: SDR family oxidoreductase, partial [Pseudomonadales bacterium]|nr:SDR family oxidoreductase [Pseudomonadales bacterium]